MTSFSGYLLATQAVRDFNSSDLELDGKQSPRLPRLNFTENAFGLKRWDRFQLTSHFPLNDETEYEGATYQYTLYVARGLSKIIILAEKRRIVDYAVTHILDRQIFPNFRKVSIFVDKLIDHCATPSSEFLITSLHGRFSGSNTSLRSMSLYGDDVTQAPLYSDYHHFFNFHTCGLGRRLFGGLPRLKPNDEGEIVKIANDGFLSLTLTSRQRAVELTYVIDFLLKNRWVEDWVPVTKDAASWQT